MVFALDTPPKLCLLCKYEKTTTRAVEPARPKKIAKGHTMTYIKLLTVLAGLALLTACGGGTGLTATNDTITPECMTNPFGDGCNRFAEALASQEIMCLEDTTADPSCLGETGIATVFCKDNPFHNSNACRADTGAIRQRQTQCVEDATTNLTCGGVIANFCRTNPFQETACLPNDTYLPLRIADCITGGKADTPNCGLITRDATKNTTLTACLENPFDVACESLDDFTTFALARTNRASFCDDSDNVADDLCTGDNVTPICEFDKFTAICPDATYGTPRQEECLMDIETNPKCTGEMGIVTLFCEADPFNAETACGHGDYDDDRQMACLMDIDEDPKCIGEMGIATVFCKANPFDTSAGCTEHPKILGFQVASCFDANNNSKHSTCPALVLVNHADYLASFGDTPPPATVALAIANTDIQSHFLSVDEEDGIDKTELTGNITDNTLRLGGVDTDTEDTNGVAYVLGVIEGTAQSFAGLLPTTNLGAPLPSTTADATWAGRYYHGANREIHDIDFNIDFGTGEIDATDIQGNITTKFDLDFTAEGVITGDVIINPDTEPDTAEARGLIGEQGLVGGFANTDDVGIWGANFFGGFVAVPPDPCIALDNCPANAAAWLRSFTGDDALPTTPATTDTPRHGFLQGGATTVDFGSLRQSNNSNPLVRTLNLKDATYNNVGLGGDKEDGIAYFEARIGGADVGFAGILSGTNLGAPLPAYVADTEPVAVWNGKFGVRGFAVIVNQDFELNVNLQTRKIDAFVQFSLTTHYKLDADFNDKGVIVNGTVVLGNFTDNDKDMVILPDDNHKLGILTGLIGQEGAVGVFIADDAAAGTRNYSGGFVAVPPSE